MRQHRVGYSISEAAELVGVPQATLYEAVRRGDLRSARVASRIVIPATALEEMLGTDASDPAHAEHRVQDANRLHLAGRLLRAPELRTSRRGLDYCALPLVLTEAGEETVELDVVVFGRRARFAAELVEGERVEVEARFTQRRWQAQDGQERKSHRIVADRVRSLDSARTETAAS